MQYDELKFYTDGGSRGNPGPAASGVVIMTIEDKVLESFGKYLGVATNNQAEWTAVRLALEAVAKYQPKRVYAYMDSELVCRQLSGQYRVKNAELKLLYDAVKQLAAAYDTRFAHVYRAQNHLADQQVNLALDQALGLKK